MLKRLHEHSNIIILVKYDCLGEASRAGHIQDSLT